jgi:hypothetical protein
MSIFLIEPIFPITVIFRENGKEYIETFDDEDDIRYNLEWFDSEDENVIVKDGKGRLVNLKVEALEIITFELCGEYI